MDRLERITVPVSWKAGQQATSPGLLTGYASTFGNVDRGLDVVAPGAFAEAVASISETNPVPLLADHMATTGSVVGSIIEAREDKHGLVIVARLSAAPSAQDTAIKLREGHLSKLSIGYEAIASHDEQRDGRTVRVLDRVRLWETSVVVFPMNPEATISTVKSLAVDDRARRLLDEWLATEAALCPPRGR
jgi:HK97 family phage prohead protease